jgi:16S rRNA (guanine527-N7)-methyltransferase
VENTQAQLLVEGIAALDIDVSAHQQEQLLAYVALLAKWNRAYNLTAVRAPEEMVIRHLLDSLAILPHVQAGELLDVGTGAGIPGIILAVCLPHQAFTLLDSNGKKTRFVKQAALELKLPNVTVVQQRVEQYRNRFPQVICRAFAALPALLASCDPVLAPKGRLLAMKTNRSTEEQLQSGWRQTTFDLTVPGLHEARQLWVLTREGEET